MANTVVSMDGFENMAATKAVSLFASPGSELQSGTGFETGLAGDSRYGLAMERLLPVPVLNTTWLMVSVMIKRATAAVTGGSYPTLYFTHASTGSDTTWSRMGITLQGDGSIGIRKDTSAFTYSAIGIIQPAAWYHLEYRHRYGNGSNGHYEVRINGNPTAVLSGVGDNSGISAGYGTPRVFAFRGSTGGDPITIDDMIVAQSTDASPAWIGMSKVRHLPPTSTSTGQWAGSDGNSTDNHLLVDDIDAASSDYVTSTAGSAQRDLYAHGPATTGATIHAVQARAAAGLDSIGTDDFSVLVKSSSTEVAVRKTLGVGTPIWFQSDIHNTDPATAAAWTKANFDASLFGIKS